MASKKTRSIVSAIICALQIMCSSTRVKPNVIQGDQIQKLPGQPRVNFQQFSGYVNVDEKRERPYFYYFAEAEDEPDSKPLVLWLAGGPGCSSLGLGAFTENGPFKPHAGKLLKNKYSWNKVANMLYLESPAGVGFSYSDDKSFYKLVNDTMTASDNFNFLKKWFVKFPHYMSRAFYITGESYIGHYALQLARLIIQSKSKTFNFKGIALGNPLLEFTTDYNGRAEYMWSHGMISDSTYDQLNSVCSYSQIMHQTMSGKSTGECSRVRDQLISEIGEKVSIYDVPKDVCSWSKQSDDDAPKTDITCVLDDLTAYMRRTNVQNALHARIVGVSNWNICSTVMHYDVRNLETSMIGLLGQIVKYGIRVLAYSGDQDSFFPLAGTRKLVDGVAKDLGLGTTRPYRTWITNDRVSSKVTYTAGNFAFPAVAGWSQAYGINNNLTFATVRGGSHDAPYAEPERSLALFTHFIFGESLPLPLD